MGTVRDDGGNPVGGAAIIIEDLELGRRVAFTEDDGTYALRGIKPGSYDLQAGHGTFCAEDPSFVSVFWPSQINPQVRRQVDLDGGAVFEWDTVMPVDDDSDEMADRWEEEHALDTTADDGDEDPDGDGFTNLAEYRLGTDPNEVYKPEGCGCEQAPSGSWLTGAWLRRRSDRAASGSSSRW